MKPTLLSAPGRLLLGLLALSLGLAPLPTAPAAQAQVTLEARWLLLRIEDVRSEWLVQLPDRSREDRGILTERQFDPKWRGQETHPPVPTLTLNRLWQANDVATAQEIFREQADAGFPEARTPVGSVGGLGLPGLGDEAHGIRGCSAECEVIHTRIVFRFQNAVHALYTFGPKDYAYSDIAVGWAQILDERIHAIPTAPGPAADVLYQVFPRQLAMTPPEIGREAFSTGEGEGSDGRGQWYWTRSKRDLRVAERERTPADVYSKVWVAPSVDLAREIFAEQAAPGFPEATQPVGSSFPMEGVPNAGNDNFGWSGCEDCLTDKLVYVHQRYVLRVGNVVIVLYTWGDNDSNTPDKTAFYAEQMKRRLPQ